MSLIESISNFKAAETAAQVQYAVAAKALQTSKAQGQAMVQLIEAAAESMKQAIGQMAGEIGAQIDVRA
jgi:hypothetical protein